MASLLPPRPFLDTITLRVALLWLFLHAVAWVGPDGGGATPLGPPASALLVCAAVLVVMRVELWRRSETVFLANLGCPFARVAGFVIAECTALEMIGRLALA